MIMKAVKELDMSNNFFAQDEEEETFRDIPNEVFGKFLKEPLRQKNEDESDALMLSFCYHLRRLKSK
jgi:hypothetical protein